jgi:cullin 3
MIDGSKYEDLGRMYRLFFQVSASSGGPLALRKGLKETIITRGKIINEASDPSKLAAVDGEDENDPKGKGKINPAAQALTAALKWVQDSLELKDKFDLIMKHSLMGDSTCELAITEVS